MAYAPMEDRMDCSERGSIFRRLCVSRFFSSRISLFSDRSLWHSATFCVFMLLLFANFVR